MLLLFQFSYTPHILFLIHPLFEFCHHLVFSYISLSLLTCALLSFLLLSPSVIFNILLSFKFSLQSLFESPYVCFILAIFNF
jgi:hypothetical protein